MMVGARLSILAKWCRGPPSSPRELAGQTEHASTAVKSPGLVHMPYSWLHQLILSLPPEDRISLFQTCSQLSKQTVSSSPSVTLCLRPASEGKYVNRLTSRAAWVRYCLVAILFCTVFTFMPGAFSRLENQLVSTPAAWFCGITIMALLCCVIVCCSFSTLLQTSEHRRRRAVYNVGILTVARSAVPANNSMPQHHATSLELHMSVYGCGIWQFPWQGCSSVTQLTLDQELYQLDLFQLTLALQAGALRQLRQLALYPNGGQKPLCVNAALERFAEVLSLKLGPSLTHLATNCIQLVVKLQSFTVLHSIEIGPACLPFGEPYTRNVRKSVTMFVSEAAKQLYQHPGLRTVTLRSCYLPEEACITEVRCHWELLTLDGSHPCLLEPISLANLKEVRFANGVPLCFERDTQQLARLRTTQGPKVTCTSARFCLVYLCQETPLLTRRLMGVRTVRMLASNAQLPHWLSLLWLALPPTACSLELCNVSGISAPEAWQGMPDHISSLLLDDCSLPADALVSWLKGLPSHVQRVAIKATSSKQLEKWQEAGLSKARLGHVRFELYA